MARRHRRAVCSIALAAAACEGSDGVPSSEALVYDSAGITIIDNGELDRTLDLLSAPSPVLAVGVVDGAVEYQLHQVTDAKRLADGGFAVANSGTRELRIYNADGSHRATSGGPGQGPAEFRYPTAVLVHAGDTIAVQDIMDLVYFEADGAFARRQTVDRAAFYALWEAGGGGSEGGLWTADGSFFAPVYQFDQSPPTSGPLYRPPMTLTRVSADFTSVDTLGGFGGILQQYVDAGGGGPSSFVPPFYTNTTWALGARDGTITAADNALPQMERFHPDGSHSIIRWSATSEAVSESEANAWRDRMRERSSPERLPTLERGWAAMDSPETKPFYGRATAGSDGRIWVRPVGERLEETTLTVFDRSGVFEGFVTTVGDFVAYDSGPGWVIGIVRDENDVEYLRMYELVR